MAAPEFWNDQERAREVIDKANGIKRWTEPVGELDALLEEVEVYLEMGAEDAEAALRRRRH